MDIRNLVELPEEIIVQSMEEASAFDTPTENVFLKIYNKALVYKEAEMTPIYIVDRSTMEIYVVAKETFGKRLH